MKIVLKINDIEYSRAFQNSIASYDKDILVEVCIESNLEEIDNRTIIVSDAEPETLDKRLLKQTVFLTVTPCDATQINRKQKYNSVFKYLRMPQILSFIEEVYFSLTGEMERIDSAHTKVFSVCSESNAGNSILCKALARQITYRHGGEILILPLRYINEYFNPIEADFNKYSRMLYYLKSNKKCVLDSYLFKDSYGINYISISRGINPINMLEIDELLSLIKTFCEDKFKTIMEGLIIFLMPIIVILFLNLCAPDYIAPLYESIAGRIIMTVVLISSIGIFGMIRKVTSVEI